MQGDSALQPGSFAEELGNAANSFDRKRVEELSATLIRHLHIRARPFPLKESKSILNSLRRKRYQELITKVADALLQSGQKAPDIRKHYAQALLDLGQLTAGTYVLYELERQCIAENNEKELAEARGLLGRAYKQMYMDAALTGRPATAVQSHLESAISCYGKVFSDNKVNTWHGVNQAALLDRAKKDKVSLSEKFSSPAIIAGAVLEQIENKKGPPDIWDCATAGESCLVLKDYPQALKWIIEYTADRSGGSAADAFEFASTLRQFEEVWQLTDQQEQQAQILLLLKAALLRQEGGRVDILNPVTELSVASTLDSSGVFEQVLGKDRYQSFKWYMTGLERAAGVAQICDRFGDGLGTGFLVKGEDLHHSVADEWVVVTNAHVLSDDLVEQGSTPAALPSDEARIRFEAKDPDMLYEVDKVLFSSPRNELDCTIISLGTTVAHDKPYPIARRLPLVDKNQRVYIIGHPRGGGLSYSIQDNLLLDHEKPKVHYRAPTEGGSSGSPIFNQAWDLIALHHAGGMDMKMLNGKEGTYPANEGIDFVSIQGAFAALHG